MTARRPFRAAQTLATWFGCGRVPLGPGTVGTLGAIPLYLLVQQGGLLAVALTALVLIAVGAWASGLVAADLGEGDPQSVVIDEVAGLHVAMLAAPPGLTWLALGFVLFRVFDIVKPWPARAAEKLPGGWGIVMDDVVAGAMAAGVLLVLRAVA